jgi:hypothetical protein
MKNGLTFLEVLIIIVIIGLLTAIVVPIIKKHKNLELEKEELLSVSPSVPHKIVVIDGCQYIESLNRTYGFMNIYTLCHKGDCTNAIHKMYAIYNQKQLLTNQ